MLGRGVFPTTSQFDCTFVSPACPEDGNDITVKAAVDTYKAITLNIDFDLLALASSHVHFSSAVMLSIHPSWLFNIYQP